VIKTTRYAISTLAVFLGLLACNAYGAESDAGRFSVSTGFDYSSGKYGTSSSTDILYIPVSVKYETDTARFKLTVPYLRISGEGNVILAGVGSPVVIGKTGMRMTDSGLGDVVASAFGTLIPEAGNLPSIDLGVKIKFGTADETKGLGTGKNDYSLQADVTKTYDKLTAFATLGYKWVGDPPGFALNNVLYGTVGGAYKFATGTSAGILIDYRQAASPGQHDPQELTLYASHKLSPDLSLVVYIYSGFSDGSPDIGGGLQIAYRLSGVFVRPHTE
jgi:hypothetical protein